MSLVLLNHFRILEKASGEEAATVVQWGGVGQAGAAGL